MVDEGDQKMRKRASSLGNPAQGQGPRCKLPSNVQDPVLKTCGAKLFNFPLLSKWEKDDTL